MTAARDKDAGFREVLEDAAAVIRRLAPFCGTFEELLAMLDLAVGDPDRPGNDGQMKMLMEYVTRPRK